MRSWKTAWLPALIVLAMVVTACAPAASTAVTPSPAAKATAGSAATSAPAPKPTTGAATTAAPAATSAQPAGAQSNQGSVKIGLAEELTGNNAQNGKDNLDGFNLYMDSINWTVAGTKIVPVVEDLQSDPNAGLTKTRKLVESDKVDMVAGYTLTSICNAVAPYLKQNNVLTLIIGNCGAESLTKDPAFRYPYLWRATQTSGMPGYAIADYLIKQGIKKVTFIGGDYAGGWETEDGFAHAYIDAGGTIVQELYPALGTTDYGPFLAQIDSSANAVVAFIVGADGIRFAQQYSQYGWKAKMPLFDLFGNFTDGPGLSVLKDIDVGVIASANYATDLDTPENKTFVAAWNAKYPGRLLSHDAAAGWSGAMIIEAALKATNGSADKDKIAAALKTMQIATPKGPIKFDDYQNVVENWYIKRIDKSGNDYVEKTLQTVPSVSQFWTWNPADILKFPYSKNRGKWANMTKAQMDAYLAPFYKQ